MISLIKKVPIFPIITAPYDIIIIIVVQVVIYLSLFDDDVSMLIAFNNFQDHVTFHLQEQLQRTQIDNS